MESVRRGLRDGRGHRRTIRSNASGTDSDHVCRRFLSWTHSVTVVARIPLTLLVPQRINHHAAPPEVPWLARWSGTVGRVEHMQVLNLGSPSHPQTSTSTSTSTPSKPPFSSSRRDHLYSATPQADHHSHCRISRARPRIQFRSAATKSNARSSESFNNKARVAILSHSAGTPPTKSIRPPPSYAERRFAPNISPTTNFTFKPLSCLSTLQILGRGRIRLWSSPSFSHFPISILVDSRLRGSPPVIAHLLGR